MRITVVSLMLAILMCGSVSAHPAEGKEPAELPDWYGEALRLDADASFGRVVFADSFPEKDELSDIEKYMIAGTESSLLRGGGYTPWYLEVMNYCIYCYRTYGEVPSTLDPAKFAVDAPYGDTTVSEILLNPITDEFARLDAEEFSPGDLLVFELNDAEMDFYSDNYGYRADWFESDGSVSSNLASPVFFVRMYGESGIIWQNLHYIRRSD